MLNPLIIYYLLKNKKPAFSSPTPIKKVPDNLKTQILQYLQQKDATLKEIYEHLNKKYELPTINGVLATLVREQKVKFITIINDNDIPIKKYKYNI